MPPLSEGGPQVTVTLYGAMEGKARFSALPGGAGGEVEGGDNDWPMGSRHNPKASD